MLINYYKGEPNTYVSVSPQRRTRATRQSVLISYYLPQTTSIATVPQWRARKASSSSMRPLSNFQEISIQGSLTYRLDRSSWSLPNGSISP